MTELLKKYGWIMISGGLAATLVFFISCNVLSKTPHKPNIAIVNVNSIVKKYVQNQSKLDIDEVVLQKSTRSFIHQLEKEIEILSDNNNTLLFVSEAVLAGAKDYTPEVERKVYQALEKTRVLS